jgi:hypothetical protein
MMTDYLIWSEKDFHPLVIALENKDVDLKISSLIVKEVCGETCPCHPLLLS